MIRRRLNIGIFHALGDFSKARKTSLNHATFLSRYQPDHNYLYHDIHQVVTESLRKIRFDVIIFDVTFLCYRWLRPIDEYYQIVEKYRFLSEQDAVRVAFPQDEYDHSAVLDEWLDEYKVDLVYAVVWNAWDEIYPRTQRRAEILKALTGYVDDEEIRKIAPHALPFSARPIDVGYRARKLPYEFGRHGQLKATLGDRFLAAAAARPLKLDISTRLEDTLLGDSWLEFLGRSKWTLGCESGSSILDPRGEIRERIKAYLAEHPAATYEETEAACFARADRDPPFSAVGPRLFEVAAARSGQILVPAHYLGVLQPGVHYLPLNHDFSNVDEVLDRLSDSAAAEQMIRACWDTLIAPDTFRYSRHAAEVMGKLQQKVAEKGLRRHIGIPFRWLADAHQQEAERDTRGFDPPPESLYEKASYQVRKAIPKPLKRALRPVLMPIVQRLRNLKR